LGNSLIRVLVAEDHTLVRQMLRLLLRSMKGFEVVGEASNGFEAVEKATSLHPDVVLMDLLMPELDGLEATRRIKKALPEVRILVLTGYGSERTNTDAMEAGASGCVNKTAVASELEQALRQVYRGQHYVSAIPASIVDLFTQERLGLEPRDLLTAREKEIIQLIGEGSTNRQIAKALFVSVKTVESHKLNIMNKLDLRSSADLYRYATIRVLVERESAKPEQPASSPG